MCFRTAAEGALEYIRAVRARRDCLVLAVVLRDGDRHIGNISLQSIDPISRSAEFAIVMGDKATWGKGYGEEAGALIVAHGFRALNLHRIYCGTFESNQGMRKLAERLGMREEGRRRDAAFKDGEFVDVIEYGVLDRRIRRTGSLVNGRPARPYGRAFFTENTAVIAPTRCALSRAMQRDVWDTTFTADD